LLKVFIQLSVHEFKLSPKLLYSYLKGDEKHDLSPSEELREYLVTFDIRQNEITGEQIIKKNGNIITLDELELELETERYEIRHLKKYLNIANKNITVVKTFNPLRDFFMTLADEYKGEKLISILASCIPATDFKDKKEPGYYQKRLEYYLRKWLYKAAGMALGIDKNDVMLLWVAPDGGSGKSKLNQWLFSLPEFDNYYLRLFSSGQYSNMAVNASTNIAIDFDELPLSKKKYQEFKSTITAEKIQRWKAKKGNTASKRFANFLGSTNKANRRSAKGSNQTGFLLEDDEAMMRRIIPLDITGGIDWQRYIAEVDLRQLWGEAASGIIQAQKSGNTAMLKWDNDWEKMIEDNLRYVNGNELRDKNTILKIVKPSEKGKGAFLSATEIIELLNVRGIKHSLTKEKVGRLLASNGYSGGRKGKGRGYYVNVV